MDEASMPRNCRITMCRRTLACTMAGGLTGFEMVHFAHRRHEPYFRTSVHISKYNVYYVKQWNAVEFSSPVAFRSL